MENEIFAYKDKNKLANNITKFILLLIISAIIVIVNCFYFFSSYSIAIATISLTLALFYGYDIFCIAKLSNELIIKKENVLILNITKSQISINITDILDVNIVNGTMLNKSYLGNLAITTKDKIYYVNYVKNIVEIKSKLLLLISKNINSNN